MPRKSAPIQRLQSWSGWVGPARRDPPVTKFRKRLAKNWLGDLSTVEQHRPWMRALDLLLISRLGGCLGDQERSPRVPRRFKADRTFAFSRNPARDCELSTNSGTDLDQPAVGPEFARQVHGHRHEREHAGREPIGAVNEHHRPRRHRRRSPVRWEFRYPGLGIVAAYQPIRDPLTRSPQGKRTSG